MGVRTPRALQTSSVPGWELALGLGGMDPPTAPHPGKLPVWPGQPPAPLLLLRSRSSEAPRFPGTLRRSASCGYPDRFSF